MNSAFYFIRQIYRHAGTIGTMASHALRARYAGSWGGILWSLFHPAVMVFVYWFIFSLGFKVQPREGIPFILVFLCGFIPWATFAEILNSNAQVITGNSSLIKKTLFPSEILPPVNLLVSFLNHAVMILILVLLLALYRMPLTVLSVQGLYYFFALAVFSLGLSWFISAVQVFYRDMAQILTVVLQAWFWITPVVWFSEMIPEKYLFFIRLNPMYYIIEGYRHSFVYPAPFWQETWPSLYFWAVCLSLFFFGSRVFARLKPEFAEVL